MSIESVMSSNHLILCRPLLLLPSIFPSIRVFSNESALHISGQSIGVSASVLPMNIQGWFPLGWTGWISLQSKGLSRVFSNTTVWGHQLFSAQPFLLSSSHTYTWLLEGKVISLFLTHWVCHCFSPKEQVSFNFMSAVTIHSDFGPQENEVCHCFHCFPIYLPWSDGTRCRDLHFLNVKLILFFIEIIGGLVTKSCPTLVTPMDCSPPGSSVHGILQARILEWVAISFSTGSSQPRNWTQVLCIAGRFFTGWAIEI